MNIEFRLSLRIERSPALAERAVTLAGTTSVQTAMRRRRLSTAGAVTCLFLGALLVGNLVRMTPGRSVPPLVQHAGETVTRPAPKVDPASGPHGDDFGLN